MKKLISLLVCFAMTASLCVPAFAANANEPSDTDLPPGIVLYEGETWVPANGMMPLEELCDEPGHTPPSTFRYQGYTVGDSFVEGIIAGIVVTITGLIPGLGIVSATVGTNMVANSAYNYFKDGKQVRTTYYKYIWSDGTDSWYHIVWVHDGQRLACSAYY